MRAALESELGTLQDSETPAQSFMSTKLEDVEMKIPRLQDLQNVISVDNGKAGMMQVGISSGQMKLRPNETTVGMPTGAEELRLRHCRLGLAWTKVRAKHRNRAWLQGGLIDTYRKLSDFFLGRRVYGLALPSDAHPQWSFVLSYEQELQKRAVLVDGVVGPCCFCDGVC